MRTLLLIFGLLLSTVSASFGIEYLPPVEWDEPPVVEPGKTNTSPPSDAIILFCGTDLSAWENGENWPVKHCVATAGKGMITTKQHFGDCQLHIEWSAPCKIEGDGQQRGNSGIFLMGKYEVQVLDSFDNQTYFEGQAASIYKQTPPMVNAMRKPGEWNTYDIFWTCPRFEEGELKKPAYITVVHNGVLVINHHELTGDTPWHRPPKYEDIGEKGPIAIQDHGNPVRFRNIWVREWKPPTGTPRQAEYLEHNTGVRWPAE